MGGDQELPGRVDRERQAGIWARNSCQFSTGKRTRPPTHHGGIAAARTIFSNFARISRTGRSAVHPNNTGACAAQGRSTQTQFEWKRLLSSHIGSNEHCRHRPPAASVAPDSRRRWRTSGLVVAREAWTGLVVVTSGEEYS